MNKNNQLDPGETIIIMRNGYRGKTIKGTRVFTSFHEFAEYAVKNCLNDRTNQPVGTVLTTSSWGGACPRELVVTKQGYMVRSDLQAFIGSGDKDPKRLKLTPEMLGVPEGDLDWRDAV